MVRNFCKGVVVIGLLIGLTTTAFAEPKLVAVKGSSELLGPVKAPKVIADGKFQFESSKLDMGKAADIFDGNYDTLIRTPEVNPAFFQFAAESPVSFRGIRVKMSEDKHDYTLAAAANIEDLKAKTGSYRVLSKGSVGNDGNIIFVSPSTVSYSVFRLDAKRTSGDNYVHVLEWEFLEPVKLDSIAVDYKTRCKHGGGEPALYSPLNDNSTRPGDSILSMRIIAKAGDQSFDASDLAKVQVKSKYAKPWRGGPAWELTKPETVDVTVSIGGLTTKGKVAVQPRSIKNHEMDLDALYVERLPKINYDGPHGGWPLEGQRVIWRAHAKNWGDKAVTTEYRWTINGREESRGQVKINGGQEITLDLPWNWVQKRHTIAFEINPNKKIKEFIGHNNKVEFASDALTIGIYVEKSYTDIFHDEQYKLGIDDANGFDDWIQRDVRHWNKMLRVARFAECPEGAKDQVRVDSIRVVPDQALPFQVGDWPTNFPNTDDKTVDLIWGYPYKPDEFKDWIDIDKFKKKFAPDNVYVDPFCLNFYIMHELGHARYLVDSYGFDVHAGSEDPEKSNIQIKDDQGRNICGLYLQKKNMVHHCHYGGQMSGEYENYSPYEIVMLNRVAGVRPTKGNANGSSDIGAYLYDIPKSFKIKFTGPNGETLANDPVKVYWAGPKDNEWYGKFYDNVVDREFTTDSEGCITTDITFFDKNGKIIHTYGYANTVPIVRVDHLGKTYYIFIEVSQVNMIYNLSKDPVPTLTVEVPLRDGEPTPLSIDYGRRILPDWRLRNQFDMPK